MMAELLEYDRSEIEKKAKRMQKVLDTIVSEINKLYTKILYQIGEDWKSYESREYLNNLTNYLNDLKDLVDSIQNYIALLKVVAEKYDETMQEAYAIANTCDRG